MHYNQPIYIGQTQFTNIFLKKRHFKMSLNLDWTGYEYLETVTRCELCVGCTRLLSYSIYSESFKCV